MKIQVVDEHLKECSWLTTEQQPRAERSFKRQGSANFWVSICTKVALIILHLRHNMSFVIV